MNLKKFGRYSRFMEPMPCLGLAYIAAVLLKSHIEVEVVDAFALKLSVREILEIIKKKKPTIVGISCLTPSAPMAFSVARGTKEYNKKIFVILGNVHASALTENILKNEDVDVIVHGEGEYTTAELVKAIDKNEDFDNIKGISFKRDGKITNTPPRALIEDLDSLPYPAWKLFPVEKYGFLPFVDVKRPGLSIQASRGCPYHCTYCSLAHSKYRKRAPEKIVDEFEYLIASFPVRQIGFVDAIFPLDKQHAVDFCREMIKRGINKKVVWSCETRVDTVDKLLLQAMREAGCRRIIYGLESGVQKLLDNIGKGFALERTKKTVRWTRESGVQTVGLFMLGLPGETKKMSQQTINFAREIGLDFAKFAITIPFPGSKLYDYAIQHGQERQDWDNYTTFTSNPGDLVCLPGGLTPEELVALQQKAHQQFYLRPQVILRQLFKLRTVRIKELFFGFLSLLGF